MSMSENSLRFGIKDSNEVSVIVDGKIFPIKVTNMATERVSYEAMTKISLDGYCLDTGGLWEWEKKLITPYSMCYEKIIFNAPATIVIWKDGSKTVVKCQEGDVYDPEKGLALCFMKKALGNKGNFNNVLKIAEGENQ